MKIVINTAHQRFGGAVQVALSFINECKSFQHHDFFVWVGEGVAKSLKEDEFPGNFHFQHFSFGNIDLRKTYEINRTLRKVEAEIGPDCIISTSGPTYFHSRAPQVMGYNLGLYIYPESPFVKNLSWCRSFRRQLKKQIHFYFFKRDASAYVVQTDDVNARVRKALNTEQVYTVTNTASSFYKNWRSFPPKLPEKGENIFRFVTISSFYGHKNLELIPLILGELEKRGIANVEFVLTLKEKDFKAHIGLHKGIHNVGPINPEECPSLYAECDAMFMPTLAECFSASYPEAMMMEKCIVTADLGFAKSICGEAALYYEAMNAEAGADQIGKLIKNRNLQKRLIAKGIELLKTFDSPQERARKYIELCDKLGNSYR